MPVVLARSYRGRASLQSGALAFASAPCISAAWQRQGSGNRSANPPACRKRKLARRSMSQTDQQVTFERVPHGKPPYRDATGTNTMAETVAIDRPPVAKPVSRPRSRKPATVSASALALHLDCSRTYIGKLEAEGVIQRQGDGFPLDQSRVALSAILAARAAAIAAERGCLPSSLRHGKEKIAAPAFANVSTADVPQEKVDQKHHHRWPCGFGWHSRPQEIGLICAMLGELLNFLPGS